MTLRTIDYLYDHVSASNPTITVNDPRLYSTWYNTTSGELFICVDNAFDDNVWKGNQGTTIT